MIAIVELTALPLFALVTLGFILCVTALVRAMLGRRKIPYIAVASLVVPIVLMFISAKIARSTLEKSGDDASLSISVSPEIQVSPKIFIGSVVDNMYSFKGASGSSPTSKKYRVELCSEINCYLYVVSQDSRDPEMYWVSFNPSSGVSYPLGFTRLQSEKI
jgi:hypothetical protein